MMKTFLTQLVALGCFMCGFVALPVSSSCVDFEMCFYKAVKGDPTTSSMQYLDDFCRKKEALLGCFDKDKGCPKYKYIMELMPDKNTQQLDFLCDNKDMVQTATDCIAIKLADFYNEIAAMGQCYLDTPFTLGDHCQYLANLTDCSKLLRATFKCSAKFMIKMEQNGVPVDCIGFYKSLVDGTSSGGESMKISWMKLGTLGFLIITRSLIFALTKV